MTTNNKPTLNDFLGHKTRDGGNYLKKWTKRQPPMIDVALHTKCAPLPVWQHGKPRVQEVKHEGSADRVREAWGGTVNCIEPEGILRAQYRRIEETGLREAPPTVCPMCLMVDAVRMAVKRGQLKITTPVFRWCGDDPAKAVTVTAGGMYNGYGDKKLSREAQLEIRKAGTKLGDVWRENMMAKCNYVFVIADLSDPQSGAMITTETTAVGDKMKGAIRDRMTQLGEDEGNPFLNPVAFRWEHFPNAQNFGDKYKCLPMPKLSLDAVDAIIRAEPPTTDHVKRAPNMPRLRADLEAACLVELPWDGIFARAEALYAAAQAEDLKDAADAEFPDLTSVEVSHRRAGAPGDADELGPDEDDEPAVGLPAGETSKPVEELYDCDACGKPMPAVDACPHCSRRYDASGKLLPEEPAPKPRRRSAAKKSAEVPAQAKAANGNGERKVVGLIAGTKVTMPEAPNGNGERKVVGLIAGTKVTMPEAHKSKDIGEIFADGDDMPAWAKNP